MNYLEKIVPVNGINMNVAISGEGPDVLLVHGYPDTHEVWRKQIPVLVKAGYRVIAPDTRGCGKTDMSGNIADYHIDNLVQDLVALLDALDIHSVHLVAHDWGSAIAWQLAIEHPERVNRYAALSTGHLSAYTSGGLVQKIKGYYTMLFQLRGLTETFLSSFNWLAFRVMTGYPEEMPQWQSQLSRPGRLTAGLNYYRANAKLFISGKSANAQIPVLGVWSSGDRFLAEGQMRRSGDFVDNYFRFERIENANHWLQLSGAEQFNPLLLEFLQQENFTS